VRAAAGENVSLYYDGRPLRVGDVLQTRTGRCYLVIVVRVQTRGRHAGRQHLRAVVADQLADIELGAGARVVALYWYRRQARTGSSRPVAPWKLP
jgi:hypothetical protein